MDKTAYCRDKCASSADMLTCMNDCQGRPMASAGPVSPFRAKLMARSLNAEDKKALIGSAVAVLAIVVVGGAILYMKKNRAPGRY